MTIHLDSHTILSDVATQINASTNQAVVGQLQIVADSPDLSIIQKSSITALINEANVPLTPDSLGTIKTIINSIINHLDITIPEIVTEQIATEVPGVITGNVELSPVIAYVQQEVMIAGIIDGDNKRFVLSKEVEDGTAIEIYNGSEIYQPSTLTIINSTTVDLPSAPNPGDELFAIITPKTSYAKLSEVTLTGDINEINTIFVLSKTPVPGSAVRIFNGSLMYQPSTIVLSGESVTLPTAPKINDSLFGLISTI
jgi:hypothetical protein